MTPVEGTPLWVEAGKGRVEELHAVELALELREFVRGLELSGTVFRSNHASNTLALSGTLPKDKARLLATLDRVLADAERAPFVPDGLRGL
jgi:hypothetical protein